MIVENSEAVCEGESLSARGKGEGEYFASCHVTDKAIQAVPVCA